MKRSSICWRNSGGTDNGRQKTRNHGYDVIVGGRLFTDYSDHLANLSLNQNSNPTGAGRYDFFPVGGMPTASSSWKTSLQRKSGRCGIVVRSVAALYLWLIVVISVRQSTVAAISGLHCQALVMAFNFRLTTGANSKRAERSEDWCVRQSHHRLSPLWLSASCLPVMGCFVITVIFSPSS